jgi:N-acyl-L-homoserine lactone synthetase
MLHVVTSANQHLYEVPLKEMHRQRYEEFVQRQGWKLPVHDGGEYDEGDDERAVYLIALDGQGHCCSSIRMRPADDFSYVIDCMPQWIDGDAQALRAQPGLWELARWNNTRGRSTGEEMRIGVLEYMLSHGATQAISCLDTGMMTHAIQTGSRLKVLGHPRRYPEGGEAVAVALPVSAVEVEYLRDRFCRRDRFLIEIPSCVPWADLPVQIIERAFCDAALHASSDEELNAGADALLASRCSTI